MKGGTGTNTSTVIIPVSHSRKAVKKRQDKLKEECPESFINYNRLIAISKFKRDPESYRAAAFRRMQASNDLNKQEIEFERWFTLVKGVEPIRHQMMTVAKSRKLNRANCIYGIGLKWVLGRQKLATKINVAVAGAVG